MRHLALFALVIALSTPVAAEEEKPGDTSEGLRLLEEGAELLLRGLIGELEPAIEGLKDSIDDLSAYHPPEILPNGDIIFRRKKEIEIEPETDGDVEL